MPSTRENRGLDDESVLVFVLYLCLCFVLVFVPCGWVIAYGDGIVGGIVKVSDGQVVGCLVVRLVGCGANGAVGPFGHRGSKTWVRDLVGLGLPRTSAVGGGYCHGVAWQREQRSARVSARGREIHAAAWMEIHAMAWILVVTRASEFW